MPWSLVFPFSRAPECSSAVARASDRSGPPATGDWSQGGGATLPVPAPATWPTSLHDLGDCWASLEWASDRRIGIDLHCCGTVVPDLSLACPEGGPRSSGSAIEDAELNGKGARLTSPEAHPYGDDIYTEPDGDPDTLSNLGPLAPLAGIWVSAEGRDEHPVVDGLGQDSFVERFELQPIDRQTNGPQLFYGLRYHTHIVKPGEVETFHDQVGYWLWEPATHVLTFTLAIPRGQVLMAGGTAAPDATEFEVDAAVGSEVYGVLSNPFLDQNFRTLSYRMA